MDMTDYSSVKMSYGSGCLPCHYGCDDIQMAKAETFASSVQKVACENQFQELDSLRYDDIRLIIASNTIAVSRMQQGEYLEAMRILCIALSQLRLLCTDRDMQPMDTSTSSRECSLHPIALQGISDKLERDSTVLYNRAFIIRANDAAAEKANVTALVQLTLAVLLYNSGLANHRLCIETADDISVSTAVLLYSEFFWMAEKLQLSRDESVTTLLAALYHNVALLFGNEWRVAEARYARKKLSELLEQSFFSSIDMEDLSFFAMGLFLSGVGDFRLAPAA